MIACFGGMLFGWDIGSIGGIIVMDAFKAYAYVQSDLEILANLSQGI